MRQVCLALVAVGCLTAFAPAPFPRRAGRADSPLALHRLKGDWKVISLWRYGNNKAIAYRITAWKVIRIRKGQWVFCSENNGVITPSTTYDLVIDPVKHPATIDFRQPGKAQAWMAGVIRLRGDLLEVLYMPHAKQRPANFDDPPPDFYLFTLTRDK